MLSPNFFNQDPQVLTQSLLGKVLRFKSGQLLLSAQIIETEAYYLEDKASHSSLGYTEQSSLILYRHDNVHKDDVQGYLRRHLLSF